MVTRAHNAEIITDFLLNLTVLNETGWMSTVQTLRSIKSKQQKFGQEDEEGERQRSF